MEEEVAVRRGDKFVVRFYSPMETIGGGVVLEPNPKIKRRFQPEVIEELKRKEEGSSADVIEMHVKSHADTLITVSELAKLTALSLEEVEQDVKELEGQGSVWYPVREPVQLQAIDYVKHGVSICIFPEGTRNNGEELSLLPFHNGSFKIAEKTGCPIVPMSLNNTCDIFEGHIPFIKKTHVILEYGKPIYPKELDKDEKKRIGEHCSNIIRETIHKNQALV